MNLNTALELTSSYTSLRVGAFELFAERHRDHAPEGWLSVNRPVHGEVVLNVGRWALHAVNHRRVMAGYAVS